MTTSGYIHSFTGQEQQRLIDQAEFLARYHHVHLDLSGCRKVIEVGCGVGAQMRIVLRNWPGVVMTGVDRSQTQLAKAVQNLRNEIDANRATLVLGSGDALAFADHSFDGAVVFWVFEHAAEPEGIMRQLFRVLAPGSPVYITEVFDRALYTYPKCANISAYFEAFVALQRDLGGNPDAGMHVPGLAAQAGFVDIHVRDVSPVLDARMSDREERSQFLAYFESLLLSGRDELLAHGKVDATLIGRVKSDFARLAADPNAIFHYGAKQTIARRP